MIMKTSSKAIELRLSTKKIRVFTTVYKNFSEEYFKALNNCDLDFLSNFLLTFAVIDEKTAFSNEGEVDDFIDMFMKENNKSYTDIYLEIAEMVNNEGFFPKKMTKEQLDQAINNPLASLNVEEITKKAIDNAMTKMAEQEFKGYNS